MMPCRVSTLIVWFLSKYLLLCSLNDDTLSTLQLLPIATICCCLSSLMTTSVVSWCDFFDTEFIADDAEDESTCDVFASEARGRVLLICEDESVVTRKSVMEMEKSKRKVKKKKMKKEFLTTWHRDTKRERERERQREKKENENIIQIVQTHVVRV